MRRILLLLMCGLLLVSASQCSAQIFHKKKKTNKSTEASNTVEPDKQLYDKAMDDIKHGKQEVGRLSLQTLINTYPDSEYLAKAKLAIADSYFKEGGSSNVTQAVAGYKDFIVFFPFMPEAAYAQMQVAMAHYNEMPKADRDNDHARLAEEEFQTFLQKYPKDPLVPQAEQHLREVQEVLAEGQFRIAYYYYVKGDRRAAVGRLMPLTQRYPLYSKSDTALWMLGDIFEKSERKDIAGVYYGQIVRNYPLSKRADDAKGKLKAFGMPIPQPDPKAVAWMTAQQNAPRPHESLIHKPLGILHSGPDIRMAAVSGTPQMEPESSTMPGTDILAGRAGTGAGKSGIVATVVTGETATGGSSQAGTETEDVSTAPAGDSTSGTTPATDPSSATTPNAGAAPATGDGTATNPPATDAATSEPAKTDGTAPATNAAATDSTKTDGTAPAATSNNQKESSSKKKGLRKLIPW